MTLRNSHSTYGVLAKGFHWATVLGFIALYVIGFYMTSLPLGPEMFEKIGWHKSIGMLVLFVAALRLVWRFLNPVPQLPDDMSALERLGAHGAHVALYAVMFAMPLSGWAMSSAANFLVSVFGWFTMPSILSPSKDAVDFLKAVHGVMAWGILALIALHVGAALKHHFINRDDVLKRMLAVVLLVAGFTLPATASDWTVGSQSKLGFIATQTGAEFEGAFKAFDASIRFDPADLAASQVKIQIQIDSVDTQSPERDSNIVSPDWFDVKTYPLAIFETLTITKDGSAYLAKARLTMRGVTKDVTLPFNVVIEGDKAHATGELTVKRTDYGIGQGQWAAATVVGDDVRIFFDLKADRK